MPRPACFTFMVNSTCAWFGDHVTILSIDVTWALPNCLRNASLARLASAMSERLSLISSKTPHEACPAMASSSPC